MPTVIPDSMTETSGILLTSASETRPWASPVDARKQHAGRHGGDAHSCRNEDVTNAYIYSPTDIFICSSADAAALNGERA